MKSGHRTSPGRQKRTARRERQRIVDRHNEERNRQRAKRGGQPNELGVLQGQSGEQGATIHPHRARPLGKLSH